MFGDMKPDSPVLTRRKMLSNKTSKYGYFNWNDTFRAFFRSAPVGLAIVSKNNLILKANDKFCELFESIETEVVNKSITELIDDDPLKIINDYSEKETEIKYRSKTGGTDYTVDAVIKPVVDKKSKLVYYYIMTGGIGRKRIFETQALELSVIIEQNPSSIIITDTERKIQYVNPAFIKLTGYSLEEVLGKDTGVFKSDEMDAGVYEEIWKTVSSGNTWQGEIVSRKKNGERYVEYAVMAPIKEKNGRVNYLAAIKQDITLLKQQEKKLGESQRLAAIGSMTSYLLHEIKSPFASIKMNFDLIKNNVSTIGNSYNIIDREVKRLDKLLKEVLQYAREKELEPVRVNMVQAVNYGAELLEPLLKSKRIQFKNSVSPAIIKADAQQLKSLFLYLLENSVDAIDFEGEINVWSETKNGVVTVYFKDNGCGIDCSLSEKIFEPFYTSKPKGSGLGLALARKIAEKHSGSIELFSGRKGETVFKIKIPAGL